MIENNIGCQELDKQVMSLIRENNISVHKKLPSLRKMATTFGVSVPMVRKAVSNLEKSGKVCIRHGSGVYVADAHSDSLVETIILRPINRNKTICIIDAFAEGDARGHYVDSFILEELIQGTKEVCLKSQWGLKVLSFAIGKGEEAVRKIAQEKDAISVINTCSHFLDHLDALKDMGVSNVTIGPVGLKSLRPQTLKHEICVDLYEAGSLAGNFLAEMGHKNVLYIGMEPSIARISGLRHAGFCCAHKAVFPQGKIYEVFVSDVASSSGQKQLFLDAAQNSLAFMDSVSAVCISSDQIAMVVVPYFLQHGIRIPQTVSLITLDNSRFGTLFTPMWTSVDLNRCGVAKAASELLLAWDNGLHVPPFYIYSCLVPPRLVVRDSVVLRVPSNKDESDDTEK
jgi:DNA-binding LacI/PurR family transcriptional regulator